MLAASAASAHRGARPVLAQASLGVLPGEVLSVLGANGAGKSTLLALLSGELKSDAGSADICLNGRALSHLRAAQLARARAVLPQQSELAFDLDVQQVVAMGAYPFPEVDPQLVEHRVAEALACADVAHLAGRRYPELSGGERQRVHFARVVLQILCAGQDGASGSYLLLDEPTASLDPLHQHGLLRQVRQLARRWGLGVLLILHDVNLAALWSDRIALLAQGRVLACGAPAQVLTVEGVRQVYGMEVSIGEHPLHPGIPLVIFG
ncbi:MAG: heme ABC transporter ATP-binding protein [Castellaniella sp.]|uniref:heme ABC transporter ATP-binding protein n=1 Tax=Castellaniella sp. TaxID=1955812 RepID=UPI003C749977